MQNLRKAFALFPAFDYTCLGQNRTATFMLRVMVCQQKFG